MDKITKKIGLLTQILHKILYVKKLILEKESKIIVPTPSTVRCPVEQVG